MGEPDLIEPLPPELQRGATILVQAGKTHLLCIITGDNPCRYCGERILWAQTPALASMPVDIPEDPAQPAISHFASCPGAAMARKEAAARKEGLRPRT